MTPCKTGKEETEIRKKVFTPEGQEQALSEIESKHSKQEVLVRGRTAKEMETQMVKTR